MRDNLVKIREFFIEQKYRFDYGRQYLGYVNFALLVIIASDKLKAVFPFRIRDMLVVFIPLAFLGTWLGGYFLDRFIKLPQRAIYMSEKRSPSWAMTQQKLDRIISLLGETS
ncbi:MAG: hypothetical protein ACE5HY_04335 [Candidatus Hydrothermarchaeales archaeon]